MGGTLSEKECLGNSYKCPAENSFKCQKCKCKEASEGFQSILLTSTDQILSVKEELVLTEVTSLDPPPLGRDDVAKPSNGYAEFCSCGGSHCNCASENFSTWQKVLPRNAPFWPKMKLAFLLLLGSVPWVFLIVYITLHYVI